MSVILMSAIRIDFIKYRLLITSVISVNFLLRPGEFCFIVLFSTRYSNSTQWTRDIQTTMNASWR